MANVETIHERIRKMVNAFGQGKNTIFANIIGVSEANIRGYSKGVVPKQDVLEKIVRTLDVSSEWLLTGNGEMIKGTIPVPSSAEIEIINGSNYKMEGNSIIPLYNLNASAGLSSLFASGGELLGNISVPNMPKCDGAVYVIGDSMYPLLKGGDIIAYNIVHSLEFVQMGEIYIIQMENDGDTQIVVKYINKSEKGDGYYKLVSYNKNCDPKDIPIEWVKAIARVTLSIRKFSFI